MSSMLVKFQAMPQNLCHAESGGRLLGGWRSRVFDE
jgi:hypothetical protein